MWFFLAHIVREQLTVHLENAKSSRDGGKLIKRFETGSQVEFQGGDILSPPYAYILQFVRLPI